MATTGYDRATALLDASPDATAVLDRSGTITAVNRKWCAFAAANGGTPATTGVGVSYLDTCLRSAAMGCDDAAIAAAALRAVLDGEVVHQELEYPCPTTAQDMWFVLRIDPIGGPVGGAMMTHVDVTRLKVTSLDLAYRANHDPLTGLANRRLFHTRLAAALEPPDSRPPHVGVGLLYIDLDGLKKINDVHGHQAGDAVLHAAACRLRGQIRAQDTVARLGGDEFAVIAPNVSAAELAGIMLRAERLLAEPHRVRGRDLYVPASIGAHLAAPGDQPDEALQHADAAMYEAKRWTAPYRDRSSR